MAAIVTISSPPANNSPANGQTHRGPFANMTSRFFMWGLVADVTKSLQLAFIVPLIAYAYVAFYGAKGHKIGRQNLS